MSPRFKRTMDLVYVTAADNGTYVANVELEDGYKTRAFFEIRIVGDKLRQIVLHPFTNTTANTKPAIAVDYPHEPTST